MYRAAQTNLLPKPTTSHYTFNLRDLSKVFQGLLMAAPSQIQTQEGVVDLWLHEECRVFRDRFVEDFICHHHVIIRLDSFVCPQLFTPFFV